ncbi:MAG: TerD family protein [Thermochromatium sp.]
MKTLPRGAHAPLSSVGPVRLELRWPAGRETPDTLCFAVGADGRIPSDDWFVFYNQPRHPMASWRWRQPPRIAPRFACSWSSCRLLSFAWSSRPPSRMARFAT